MQSRRVLAAFRALLARGATLQQAADELGPSRRTLQRLADRHRLKRRRRGLSREKALLLKRYLGRMGGWKASKKAGVSRSTAWRHQQLANFRGMIERSKTPLPCKPWRCPKCGGLIKLTICIKDGVHKPPTAAKRRRKTRPNAQCERVPPAA